MNRETKQMIDRSMLLTLAFLYLLSATFLYFVLGLVGGVGGALVIVSIAYILMAVVFSFDSVILWYPPLVVMTVSEAEFRKCFGIFDRSKVRDEAKLLSVLCLALFTYTMLVLT